MGYEIRTYSEEYLEKQVEIGSSILNNWLGAQQTPLESLRKAFSKEGFDPTTKFYAFQDNQIVGFLTSGVSDTVANMEFPIVLPEHEAAENLLIEAAYSSFKNRGITQVISRVSPRWGKTVDFANKHGYEKKDVLWISSRLYVKDFTLNPDTNDVLNVDMNMDLDEIKPILVELREMSSTAVDSYFDSLKKIAERITSWVIIRKDGKIVGHDVLVQDKFDSNKARMNAIYTSGDDAELIRDKIMGAHVKAAKENGIKYIDSFFWGPTEHMSQDYAKYGFEISDVTSYSKKL
ncbi:MAG: hypothetical protein GPJ54_03645 [Candidatus Heimdallarchaeota archaeon]|nr:hypothetical protein [Candidatus Heimdallarchaeota archaeon]